MRGVSTAISDESMRLQSYTIPYPFSASDNAPNVWRHPTQTRVVGDDPSFWNQCIVISRPHFDTAQLYRHCSLTHSEGLGKSRVENNRFQNAEAGTEVKEYGDAIVSGWRE